MRRRRVDGAWHHDALLASVARSVDAQVLCDASGSVVFGNRAASALLGVPEEDLPGVCVQDFGRDTMQAFQQVAVEAVAVNGIEVTVRNCQVLHADGSRLALDLTLSPVRTDRGTLVALGLRGEADRYGQTQLFRGLLEAAPDAMVIVNDLGTIVLVNAQVEHLFGYGRDELVGQPVEMLVPERFAIGHLDFRLGYNAEPRTRGMGGAEELFARRKDGSEFPVEISLAPLETDQGLLVSAAVRDISERKRLQADADRARDEYFATVSHELRTPLTSILGYAELLADTEELSIQGRRFLDVISRSAARELRLVNDLLTVVNIEQSGFTLQRRRFELGGLVQESAENARPGAEEAGLELGVRLPREPLLLEGDRDRLGQAVDNLISNAVKFGIPGGAVYIELRQNGQVAEIDVRDTGPGLGEADRDQIFERLYRAPDAVRSQVPGAGLGLPITRAIVGHHGGEVHVHSTGPTGTTFRITLPLEPGAASRPVASSIPRTVS